MPNSTCLVPIPTRKNEEAIKSKVTGEPSLVILRAHLDRLQAGDYFAILAFLEMNDQNVQSLEIGSKSVEEKIQYFNNTWIWS